VLSRSIVSRTLWIVDNRPSARGQLDLTPESRSP